MPAYVPSAYHLTIICVCYALIQMDVGVAQEVRHHHTSTLLWNRDDNTRHCASQEDMQSRVAQLFSEDEREGLVAFEDALMIIDVQLQQEGGTIHADLRMYNKHEMSKEGRLIRHRELSSSDPTCRELEVQAALAIASMIDSGLYDRSDLSTMPGATTKAPSHKLPEPSVHNAAASQNTTSSLNQTTPPKLELALGGLLAHRSVPKTTWGLALGVGYICDTLYTLRLELSHVPQSEHPVTVMADSLTLNTHMWSAAIHLERMLITPLHISGFIGAEASSLSTSIAPDLEAQRLVPSFAFGLRWAAMLSEQLFVSFVPQLNASLKRLDLRVNDSNGTSQSLYERPILSFRMTIGLGVRL